MHLEASCDVFYFSSYSQSRPLWGHSSRKLESLHVHCVVQFRNLICGHRNERHTTETGRELLHNLALIALPVPTSSDALSALILSSVTSIDLG